MDRLAFALFLAAPALFLACATGQPRPSEPPASSAPSTAPVPTFSATPAADSLRAAPAASALLPSSASAAADAAPVAPASPSSAGQTARAAADPVTGHPTPAMAAKAERDLGTSAAPQAPGLPRVEAEVVAHGPRDVKRIALTFDACSTRDVSQYDQPVTDVLIKMNAKATIFLGGLWAKEEAAHVKQLAASPLFELGNHSYTHPHMAAIQDDARIARELERTQAEVFALTGRTPTLFRPPYGEYDDRLVRDAAAAGLTTIEYDLASGDPDVVHATKERLIEWVLRKAQAGSIIVMHINHLRFHTAEALPGIIEGLRARGYELVTVSELLRDSHGLRAER